MNEGELDSLIKDFKLKAQVLSTYFDIRKGLDGALEKALQKLCEAADEAVRDGCQLLILSDRSEELVSIFLLHLCAVLAVNYKLHMFLYIVLCHLQRLEFIYFWWKVIKIILKN